MARLESSMYKWQCMFQKLRGQALNKHLIFIISLEFDHISLEIENVRQLNITRYFKFLKLIN